LGGEELITHLGAEYTKARGPYPHNLSRTFMSSSVDHEIFRRELPVLSGGRGAGSFAMIRAFTAAEPARQRLGNVRTSLFAPDG